jgi:hypothetical protein
MKTLEFNQSIEVTGGGPERTCTIAGGLVVLGIIGGFWAPPLWGAALSITGGAAFYGCFN